MNSASAIQYSIIMQLSTTAIPQIDEFICIMLWLSPEVLTQHSRAPAPCRNDESGSDAGDTDTSPGTASADNGAGGSAEAASGDSDAMDAEVGLPACSIHMPSTTS